MSELTSAQTDKLLADLKVVVADADELLRTTAGHAGVSSINNAHHAAFIGDDCPGTFQHHDATIPFYQTLCGK